MTPPLLRFQDVSLGQRLLGVNVTVEEGQVIALVGPNGAGKSTFLRLALGLEEPDRGTIFLGGRPLSAHSVRERAQQMAWLPQFLAPDAHLTAQDLVALSRLPWGESEARASESADRALREEEVGHLASRRVGQLSGGELQRVLLATLWAHEGPLVLADEPASHLDPAHQATTYERLRRLQSLDRTLVVVTHDVGLLHLLGPQLVVQGLKGGRTSFSLPLADPALPEALTNLYSVRIERQGRLRLAACHDEGQGP